MLQVVKRLAALAAIAVALCGCDVYDIKGMFVPTSDLVGVRFEQSLAKTGNKSVATIEASEEYMFYVCTDPHVDGSHRNMTSFNDALRTDAKASFGIVLGDVIDRIGMRPLYMESVAYDAERHTHNYPIFNVLGNHDLFFDGWAEHLELVGPSVYWWEVKFDGGSDLFIVLDSATGTLGAKQTKWLREFLANNRTRYRHCIISKHTNLFNTDNTQSTSGNMPFEESFALFELLSRNNVTLVLQGHDHYREDLTYGGVRYTVVGTIKDASPDPEYLKVRVTPSGVEYEWETEL
ncbi:MAG: metallophosphoesterase [Tidjanibacter sp.]|nr:metallophosphoesterase [Tidjanibacter sp.]